MSLGNLLLQGLLAGLGRLPDDMLRAGSRALFSGSWRRFVAATADPDPVQTARLLALVSRAAATDFGKAHGFEKIKSVDDFRSAVPIRGFEGFEPYLLRMVAGEKNVLIPDEPFFFARTSGTTGTPKYIPVTQTYVAEYRLPRRVFARQVMQAFPGLVRGKILTVHSPKIEGQTPGGQPYGSITLGLSAQPGAVEAAVGGGPLDLAPRSLFLVEDFELRYYALLRLAAQTQVSLCAAINPSTLVLLAKKLDQHAERLATDLELGRMDILEALPGGVRDALRPLLKKDPAAARRLRESKLRHGHVVATELWPKVAGLLCWKGGSAPFYLAQLERWFPGKQIMDYGFLATEGGFSIPLSPDGASGVVSVLGHFLEFVPEDAIDQPSPPSFLASQLDVGQRYRVVLTGAHGLYRYDINDVVQCTGHFGRTAQITFLHKGGNMLSLTGEKLAESQVVHAAEQARAATGIELVGFAVAVDTSADPPRYVLLAEGDANLAWLAAFEAALGRFNLEYEAKRTSQRLGPMTLQPLPAGAFESERARRVAAGAPDAHVKVPHLLRDAAVVARLKAP